MRFRIQFSRMSSPRIQIEAASSCNHEFTQLHSGASREFNNVIWDLDLRVLINEFSSRNVIINPTETLFRIDISNIASTVLLTKTVEVE